MLCSAALSDSLSGGTAIEDTTDLDQSDDHIIATTPRSGTGRSCQCRFGLAVTWGARTLADGAGGGRGPGQRQQISSGSGAPAANLAATPSGFRTWNFDPVRLRSVGLESRPRSLRIQ